MRTSAWTSLHWSEPKRLSGARGIRKSGEIGYRTGARAELGAWRKHSALFVMQRFYFDFEDGGATIIDNDGLEFDEVDGAIKEAIITIGERGAGFARDCSEGRIAVRVRDNQGCIVEVAATIEIGPIRK